MPWHYVRIIGISLWIFSVLALILTLIPKIGVQVGGASRWIQLPFGFRFQPSELFKVTTPFIAVYLLVLKEQWPLNKNLFYLAPAFIFALPLLVFTLQPDFGTFVFVILLAFIILFVLGLPWLYILISASFTSLIFYFMIWLKPYRLKRIMAFLNPWEDPLEKGFQVIQSLLGFSAGSLFGVA